MAQDALQSVGLRHENEAIRGCARRAAELRESLGTYHPDYATALNQLSLLLIMQGEADAAEPFLREALEVRRIALGELHPDYATNLSSLGGILWARGDLEEAEPILGKVFEIRAKTLGAEHPKTQTSRNSYQQVAQARKQWQEECLDRMQRTRLGAANETITSDSPEAPPLISRERVAIASSPTSADPIPPTAAPSLVAEAQLPITVPVPGRPTQSTSRAAPPEPIKIAADPELKNRNVVSIPDPLSDSIDSILANHLDSAIRNIPGLDSDRPLEPPRPLTRPPKESPVLDNPLKSDFRLEAEFKPPEPTASSEPPDVALESSQGVSREDLSALVESLDSSFKALSKRLTQAARELISEGSCPPDELMGACRESRARFLEVRAAVDAEARLEDPTSLSQQSETLEQLKKRLDLLEARRVERRSRRRGEAEALRVLREVERLTCVSSNHFEPLEQCRAEAESLIRTIQAGRHLGQPEAGIIDSLVDGSHPFHAILRLADASASLTDHDWSTLYQTIASRFGVPLAIAVGRGRIVSKPTR